MLVKKPVFFQRFGFRLQNSTARKISSSWSSKITVQASHKRVLRRSLDNCSLVRVSTPFDNHEGNKESVLLAWSCTVNSRQVGQPMFAQKSQQNRQRLLSTSDWILGKTKPQNPMLAVKFGIMKMELGRNTVQKSPLR